MRIQVYTSRGCTHDKQVRDIINEAVSASGDDIQVETLNVADYDQAKAVRCFGAPTVRVDGVDIEYGDREPLEYTNGCRYYNTPDGWNPFPDKQLLLGAIKRARARSLSSYRAAPPS